MAEPPVPLRRYGLTIAGLLGLFLALFAFVEALGVPLLTDPSSWLGRGGVGAAAIGVGLLVGDLVLPVPSSVVMIAHGALFGVVRGTLLSLAGSVGAAALGFWLGRRGAGLLERVVSPAEKARADELLRRWGALAVVVTRPVPLLAETVAMLAGASPLGWAKMLGASVAGALPPALLYALTGARSRSFGSGFVMFGVVLVVAGAMWLLGRRLTRRG
jgi:3-dehydroquinate synthase